MADVTQQIGYYSNLLIIQYNNLPKASATIAALAEALLASGVMFDVRDGFNVDTAVGVQLDIIGKYVGVDRFYTETDPVDYFALTDYQEIDPDSDQKYGFSDYATFDDDAHNGTITYNSIITQKNRLSDDDYRIIIKLKILQNNGNHSHASIDKDMWDFFGPDVRPDSDGNMEMYYLITANASEIVRAAIAKNILPRPMGVGLTLLTNLDGPMYGFATYGYTSPYIAGFQNYGNYGTKEGEVLTYEQVVVV